MKTVPENTYLKNLLMRLYRRQWFRSAVTSFVSPPADKKYIFVVGCYCSGTTLLEALLGVQDEISCLPTEGVALTDELKSPEDLGWNRMWHMCRNELETSRQANKPDSEKIKKEWAFWFDAAKEFWLEKSIVNSLNIDWLEEAFASPYFIWIVRNGYAVAEGIKRRTDPSGKHPWPYPRGYPIELCARQWVINNQVIEAKIGGVKHGLKIYYEDLTANPREIVQSILGWLPLENKSVHVPESFIFHQQSREIRNMNQASIRKLTAAQIDAVNSVAKDALLHYGYEILY